MGFLIAVWIFAALLFSPTTVTCGFHETDFVPPGTPDTYTTVRRFSSLDDTLSSSEG